jgi:hypothetical protein
MEYERFTLRDKFSNEIWSMVGAFSYPQIAGLIVGGNSSLFVLPEYNQEYFETTIRLHVNSIKDLTELKDYSVKLLQENVFQNDITRMMTLYHMENKEFSIWIYNNTYVGDTPLLDLYGFDNEQTLLEFLQAVRTIGKAFNLKFSLIVNCPLRADGSYFAVDSEGVILNLVLLPEILGEDAIFHIEGQNNVFPEVPRVITNDYDNYPDDDWSP